MKPKIKILYKAGYKYQLELTYSCHVPILPREQVKSDYILLTDIGKLMIMKGYAWDGPSGPAIDTKNFMRGSLVHDALYQLMRESKISLECRQKADEILRDICLEDGMSRIRAWWVYTGVRWGARKSALPENKRLVYSAP